MSITLVLGLEKEKKALTRLGLESDPSKGFEALVKGKLRENISKYKGKEEVRRMIKEMGLKIYLPEPKPPVYDISTDGHPSLGPADAPVTVVEFTDFQCPFCAKAAPGLKQLTDAYPGKVRVVFRHHPLTMHKDAQMAHEAAECAGEQGKFWAYYDLLFANQNALKIDDLKSYAANLELDVAQFSRSLESRKYEAKVKADLEEARTYKIRGVPAIFINGKLWRPNTGDYVADLSPHVERELQSDRSNGETAQAGPPGVLAEVEGITITEVDLSKGAFYDQENRLYQVKLEQVKKLLETKLVTQAAQKRGISVDSLDRQELFTMPLPQEMKAQYETFQGYVAGNPRLMRLGEKERLTEILKLRSTLPG